MLQQPLSWPPFLISHPSPPQTCTYFHTLLPVYSWSKYLITLTICLNSFTDTNHLWSNVNATEHNSCLLLTSLALLPPPPCLFEAYLQNKIDQTWWPVEDEKVFGLVVIKCKYLRYNNVEINTGVELKIFFPPSIYYLNHLFCQRQLISKIRSMFSTSHSWSLSEPCSLLFILPILFLVQATILFSLI